MNVGSGTAEVTIVSNGTRLKGHLARPGPGGRSLGVVLCHGFPNDPRGSMNAAATYPELADRIARIAGWTALAFNLRGTGGSGGDFDAAGWLEDIHSAVGFLIERDDITGVCTIGFGEGGTFAVCEAADDPRVDAVAAVAAPPRIGEWAQHPARLLEFARRVGMVRDPEFPPDPLAWGRAVMALDASAAAARLAPRPLLVLHGSDDEEVSAEDARALVDAAGPNSELRVVYAAGHRLRHDPRALATLLGWLERRAA
jgi:putative redox protein